MPDSAQVIVIGSGAFGTSIAFHLTELGIRDVLLVDRFGPGDGTTWHSGGLVGQLRSSPEIMQLISHSAACYSSLEAGGPSFGWRQAGSLRLAATQARLAEFAAHAELARSVGVPAVMLPPEETAERSALLNVADLAGSLWIPTDGYVDPARIALALAAAAQRGGATVLAGTEILGIETGTDGVTGVRTAQGFIRAGQVVVAAGYASPLLLSPLGIFLPLAVSRQQYLLSDAILEDLAAFPTVREPDHALYLRPSGQQVLLGAVARQADIVPPRELPKQRRLLFEPLAGALGAAWSQCQHRVPALAAAGIGRYVRGAEGVTLDGELVADQTTAPALWVAAGGSGHGIAAAGGVGWYLAARVAHCLDPRIPGPPITGRSFALGRFPDRYRDDEGEMLAEIGRCEAGHYDIVDLLR
jgi:glycine/D-amino acid oxidase-like deaminating enzyme